MKKILLFSLAGRGEIGLFETQLGNVAILIPMKELVKKYLPNTEIFTSIQLTDSFANQYGFKRILEPKSFKSTQGQVLNAVVDLLRVTLWSFFNKLLHINIKSLKKGDRLDHLEDIDLVIDLNGDVFPSDVQHYKILIHTLNILTMKQLKIPVIEFVSSPGPFDGKDETILGKIFNRKFLSKIFYNKMNLIINREALSEKAMREIGITTPIINTACPAFMMKPAPEDRIQEIISNEKIDINRRPLIGITLSGYNLKKQRTWRKPAHFNDIKYVAPFIKYLLDDLDAQVILLPHVYRKNPFMRYNEFINGPDYDIVKNIYNQLEGDKYGGRLRIIEGKYTSPEAKGIIGNCDIYISGRLHAAVAALSQNVPTVLLAYGHKFRGFASLLGQEKYVFEGDDPDVLKSLVEDLWNNKDNVHETLIKRNIRVKKLAQRNFQILHEFLDLPKEQQDNIPQNLIEQWSHLGDD